MKNKSTELVFILDKSGSMSGLEADTIGGFNAMLEKQKLANDPCLITTALFDNHYELLHDRTDIRAVQPITNKEYYVGGSTALLDALGRTIHKVINAHKHMAKEFRPNKVLFVVITDGEENASREYGLEAIRQLIKTQRDKWGWEFIFLGANIDAVKTAADYGIAPDRAQNFHADKKGMEVNFRVMSEAVTSYRENSNLSETWDKEIREDYKGRKKNK